MDTSAIDFGALGLGVTITAVVAGAMAWAGREDGLRRLLLTAGSVAVVLMAIGFADLMRERPRETHVATVVVGIALPVLGAAGLQRALRRTRPWIRWIAIYVSTLVLLLLGVLIGGAIVPRWLGA